MIHLEAVIGVALLAGVYAGAWRAAASRPHPARAAAFAGGLLAALGALTGPVHDLAEAGVFTAHMGQHLILMLVVPPLLLAGTPAFMADALLTPWLGRPVFAPLLRLSTRPLVAFAIYAAALVVWHLPGPYGAAVASHGVHFVQHAALVTASLLGWWPVLSPSRRLPPLPYAAQILYLFVFGMPMTVVAAMIAGAEHLIYPIGAIVPGVTALTPLEDQRLGGILMWVPAGIVPLVAFTVVFFRWAAAEPEERAETEVSAPARPLASPK